MEVGGRWAEEGLDFVRRLARARARSSPPWMRASAAQAWAYRWSALLSIAAQRAFAVSLLHLHLDTALAVDGEAPTDVDACVDARWLIPAL